MTTLLRPVHRGDRHRRARGRRSPRGRWLHSPKTDDHRAVVGQRLHQPAARGDQAQPVLEREHAGDARRHQLADAVPEHARPARSPTTATAGRAHTRSRTAPAACRRSASSSARPRRTAETARDERPLEHVARARVAAVERPAERRLGLVELAAHAGVLRALPGEEERDLRRVGALPTPCTRPGAVVPPPRCSASAAATSAATRRATASRWAKCERPALAVKQMSASGIGSRRRARARSRRASCAQRLRRSRRQRQEVQRRDRPAAAATAAAGALLEDDVRVGAAEAERADAGDPAAGRAGHGRGASESRRAAASSRCADSSSPRCRWPGISSCCKRQHDLDQTRRCRPRLRGGRCSS